MSDAPWPLPPESAAAKMLNDHAAEMGRVAMAWTKLHESLARLFAEIVTPARHSVGSAVWHSINSDRGQRTALVAGAKAALGEASDLFQHLKWGLDRLTGLEDDRNNTLHTAFGLIIENGAFKLIPIDFTGNPRAKRLKDRDLAIELSSYANNIHEIRQYFEGLGACLFADGLGRRVPLPPKPRLPRPAQADTRKASRPKTSDKPPPPRPQS